MSNSNHIDADVDASYPLSLGDIAEVEDVAQATPAEIAQSTLLEIESKLATTIERNLKYGAADFISPKDATSQYAAVFQTAYEQERKIMAARQVGPVAGRCKWNNIMFTEYAEVLATYVVDPHIRILLSKEHRHDVPKGAHTRSITNDVFTLLLLF
jgi:hypothetical protein